MNRNGIQAIALALIAGLMAAVAIRAEDAADAFPPLRQWKDAVLSGAPAAVNALYSTNPETAVYANGSKGGTELDTKFWLDQGKHFAVTEQQSWQKQGEQWRVVSVIRTDKPVLKQPVMNKDIYPAAADARAELREAETRAAAEHKRVLLVFGADWCYDCHVLDLAFQRPDLSAVLASSYEVVRVDLGPDSKKNADLVREYEIPLEKGVPAVAVADSNGKLVVSQKNGEFENARGMTAEAMLAFLNQWKPEAR